MKRTRSLAAVVVLVLALGAACKKKPETPPVPGTKPTPEQQAILSSPTKRPLAVIVANRVGIPACDEFFLKYERCIVRAPPAQREVLKRGVETLWQAWKEVARQPQGKASLPATCQKALANAQQTLAELKCEW